MSHWFTFCCHQEQDCYILFDDFDRADGAPGSDWTVTSGTWTIDTNRLKEAGTAGAKIRTAVTHTADSGIARVRVKAVQTGDKVKLWLHGHSLQYEQVNATTGNLALSCGQNKNYTVNAGADVYLWAYFNGESGGVLTGYEALHTPTAPPDPCAGMWCEASPTGTRYVELENVNGTAVYFDTFTYERHWRTYGKAFTPPAGYPPGCDYVGCNSCEWKAVPRELRLTIQAQDGCANLDGQTCDFTLVDGQLGGCAGWWESPGCFHASPSQKMYVKCNPPWDPTHDCEDFRLEAVGPLCVYGWNGGGGNPYYLDIVSCTCSPFVLTTEWVDLPAPAIYYCPSGCTGWGTGRYRFVITEKP